MIVLPHGELIVHIAKIIVAHLIILRPQESLCIGEHELLLLGYELGHIVETQIGNGSHHMLTLYMHVWIGFVLLGRR